MKRKHSLFEEKKLNIPMSSDNFITDMNSGLSKQICLNAYRKGSPLPITPDTTSLSDILTSTQEHFNSMQNKENCDSKSIKNQFIFDTIFDLITKNFTFEFTDHLKAFMKKKEESFYILEFLDWIEIEDRMKNTLLRHKEYVKNIKDDIFTDLLTIKQIDKAMVNYLNFRENVVNIDKTTINENTEQIIKYHFIIYEMIAWMNF